ncbi:MAG: hypothetical protein KGL73_04460 [Burkholderiales bacterium]|nr:hypothetical protein [Burkholderiales bacterium]
MADMTPAERFIDELMSLGVPAEVAGCFASLPHEVNSSDAESAETLRAAFTRLFRCDQAKAERDVVFIWAVDQPYLHCPNGALPTQFVYVEKTVGTIYTRWRKEYLRRITTDYADGDLTGDATDLRTYADANHNWTFYSNLIRRYGPLRIWWASCTRLNTASGWALRDSKVWEDHILGLYMARHARRPLKNRVGGSIVHS